MLQSLFSCVIGLVIIFAILSFSTIAAILLTVGIIWWDNWIEEKYGPDPLPM
jgi:hypothetical protein